MREYYLTTDATIDLSRSMAESLGIKVIPMHYLLGNTEYVHGGEGNSLPLNEFYERLKAGENASTSQITPAEYLDFFEPMLQEGKDIIYVSLSSGLSGTFAASQMAAAELSEKYPERRIATIDSVCASVGEGLLMIKAAEQMNAGLGFDELVNYIEEIKVKVCHWFTVDDLEQLKRGGRLSSFEAGIGMALHICPILSTTPEGKLRVAKKIRCTKKAQAFIVERLEKEGSLSRHDVVCVGHAGCPEYAESLKEAVLSAGLAEKVIICEIGPVIGCHVGKGMCALVFLGENYGEY